MLYLAVIWLSFIAAVSGAASLPYAREGDPPVLSVAEFASSDPATIPRCVSLRDGFLIDDTTVIQSIGDSERSVPSWEYIAVLPANHPDVARYKEAQSLPEAKRGNAPREILTRALADCRLIWMVRPADLESGRITWPSPPGSVLTGVLSEAPSRIVQHFADRNPALSSKKLLLFKAPYRPETLRDAWMIILIAGLVAGAAGYRWWWIGFVPVGSGPDDAKGLKGLIGALILVTALALLLMWYHDSL